MQFEPLLALSGLRITGIRISSAGITLVAEPTERGGCCPACECWSARIHSHHQRRLADLPAHGRSAWIQVHLPRFFCDNSLCRQITFIQRLPQVAAAHARKTTRLVDALADIAFTAGGEAGARLAGDLGMPSSPDTLLRLLRHTALTPVGAAPQVLGVDDFALRRGQVYGTILCDLQNHRTVDLLAERSSAVFAAWLKEHPGTLVISRDRGSDYAKGAREGAPDAMQVADRWHLLHNLSDALCEAVDAHQAMLDEITRELNAALTPTPPARPPPMLPPAEAPPDTAAAPAPPVPCPPGAVRQLSRAEQKRQSSRQRRLACYQQVQQLHRQGMSFRKIARTLNIGRDLAERFATCEKFPQRATPARRQRQVRAMLIDAFLSYLKQRWQEGCDNVARLYREIQTRGFTGSIYMVRRQVRRWRRAAGVIPVRGPRPVAGPRVIRPSARRIAWLALGHIREPTEQDVLILSAIYRRWPQLAETAELCRQFAAVLKQHDSDSLEAWVQLAREPGVLPPVRRFAEVLRQDWAAIVEAVRQKWSQGQTEGQVNRLKLIKRQMYGRASFDLLRHRVLHRRKTQVRLA